MVIAAMASLAGFGAGCERHGLTPADLGVSKSMDLLNVRVGSAALSLLSNTWHMLGFGCGAPRTSAGSDRRVICSNATSCSMLCAKDQFCHSVASGPGAQGRQARAPEAARQPIAEPGVVRTEVSDRHGLNW
ncbi:hypothetical protein FHR32_003007 [Streptosporangium album]|uniref:Uncharacterized protein n=1 Tax=Streptosporangium album TaxID=47479 RepID=A0A7W7RV43_9ACTN|nr:hypothetical protein [Streptosporangium album]MBB4938702.1 hypothetical protein [Streptosporangium album]